MGQTLTHGIYLPDEGERNCYDGLAANWQLLDGAVGTVAEHTTALAGKAPAVHTHTKSDITDFPVYGTTAGTICEGNDSRLSDARTPVAHTHGKADITDLFNSANTWTQSQTIKNTEYQIGETPSATKASYINFTDKNNVNIGWIQRRIEASGNSSIELFVYNRFTNSQPDPAGTTDYAMLKVGLKSDQTHFCEIMGDAYPRNNNVYNLGLSTNQWNNLYAKNYFYNGTAWGLDRANTWTSWQTFENTNGNALLRLRRTDIKIGDAIPSAQKEVGSITFAGSDNINLGLIDARDESSGHTRLIFLARQRYDSNGNRANNGNTYEARINLGIDESHKYYLSPNTNGDINLGTSTNKWKTLNGVNPGALSFPDGATDNSDTTFNPDTTTWPKDGTSFTITAQVTGWLHIRIKNATGNFVWVKRASSGNNQTWGLVGDSNSNSDILDIGLNVPVIKDKTYTLKLKTTSLYAAIFLCLGNV